MAERFPTEGLRWLFSVVPRNVVPGPSTLYLGLFTSQTATTVPAVDAVISTQTGVTEATAQ